ncbi:MAG: hypothetical protein FWE31_05190 [Firmicutes bacterium]|nr:hypothetical protein [Bacillota bacterium]
MKLREMGYRTVVAAALLFGNKVRIGTEHAWCDKHSEMEYSDMNPDHDFFFGHVHKTERGFIDSDGIFISNSEAWRIAEENGLLDENPQSFTRQSADYFTAAGSEFDIPYARAKIRENLELARAQKKADLVSAASGRDKLNEFVLDYLYELPYLKDPADAKRILAERLDEIIRR